MKERRENKLRHVHTEKLSWHVYSSKNLVLQVVRGFLYPSNKHTIKNYWNCAYMQSLVMNVCVCVCVYAETHVGLQTE